MSLVKRSQMMTKPVILTSGYILEQMNVKYHTVLNF